MNAKEFLEELRPFANQREITTERIKSHHLPVILYGAAFTAKRTANGLKSYNVPVDGFAVDADFYREGMKFMNLPVYDFANLSSVFKQYVLVLGLENSAPIEKLLQNKNEFLYSFNNNQEPINYNYIEKNVKLFIETYNLLEDELSQKTFVAYLKIKLSGDILRDYGIYDPNQYFNSVTIGFNAITRGGYLQTVVHIVEIR